MPTWSTNRWSLRTTAESLRDLLFANEARSQQLYSSLWSLAEVVTNGGDESFAAGRENLGDEQTGRTRCASEPVTLGIVVKLDATPGVSRDDALLRHADGNPAKSEDLKLAANQLDPDAGSAQETHWIPLSDLMTGLMVLFLLIAVTYMIRVEADADRVKEVAIAYSEIKDALYDDLKREFKLDLKNWKAQLIKDDLSIRFTEPDVLFAEGSSDLKPEFRAILSDFFPRYVRILTSPKYRGAISEVRIEGHTSSDWTSVTTPEDAYFRNMELSQARTRSALVFALSLPEVNAERAWLRQYLTANGLSSSHPVFDASGVEDPARSRRVEFRVRTDAETRLAKILEVSK